MTTENPDRRRILAGTAAALAGAAALNLAAIATARASEPDPVFALIDQHRTMHAAVEAQDDWEDDALSEAVESVASIHVKIGDDIKTLKGREAWALARLVEAGERGCTPINRPAPRWSDYVFKLRRNGIDVETVNENHGGAYAGHHARYVLRTPLEVLIVKEAGRG